MATQSLNPNRARLLETARRLLPVLDELTIVGGHLVDLHVTDPAAYRVRPTDDVDVVVECTTRTAYADLRERLRRIGFGPDTRPGAPVCRTRTSDGYVLDVMPLDEQILGFGNRWYRVALDTAVTIALAPDVRVRVASAPAFLLTKWEAFATRGADDPHGSHDLEDIVMLMAGRPALIDEMPTLPSAARQYALLSIGQALDAGWFHDVLAGALPDARRIPGLVDQVHQRFVDLHNRLLTQTDRE